MEDVRKPRSGSPAAGSRDESLEAVLFDYGGTLDGEGWHSFDRTVHAWREAGSDVPEAAIREAYYEADRILDREAAGRRYRLEPMLERHSSIQAEILGGEARPLVPLVVARLASISRQGWARSREALGRLRERGLRLGVVSNFHGNLSVLLDEAGLAPLFEAVVESVPAGVSKPDPEIYRLALRRLDLPPGRVQMVGDSFDRDVRPAHALGMVTVWLRHGLRPVPETGIADRVIERLGEL